MDRNIEKKEKDCQHLPSSFEVNSIMFTFLNCKPEAVPLKDQEVHLFSENFSVHVNDFY